MSLRNRTVFIRHFVVALILAVLGLPTLASAVDLLVPSQFPTIQDAVNAAQNGDRVVIAKGIYKGQGNVNIDCYGKAITIQGSGYLSTVIDCEGAHRGFIFQNGETSSTQLESLTVQNGHQPFGGAVVVINSSPAILHCDFSNNSADYGGAISISGGNPGVVDCQFEGNKATMGGGAIYTYLSSSTLSNNTYSGNDTRGMGGAIAMDGGSLFIVSSNFKDNLADQGGGAYFSKAGDVAFVNGSFSVNTANVNGGAIDLTGGTIASVTNCTFGANLSRQGPGAIRVEPGASATVSNSILWTDGTREYTGAAHFRFSCVSGGADGEGNTSDDPKLVDAIDHDLHIKIGSSVIDKGDKTSVVVDRDQDGRDRTIGSAPDMGAYEYPIVKPAPVVGIDPNNVYTVPHDGNPDTNTVQVTLHGGAYDWLLSALSYLWSTDEKVLGTAPDLTLTLGPGERVFKLDVRDSNNNSNHKNIHVKVLPEQNDGPVANAGPDINVVSTGGTVHVVLHGHGYDPDGDSLIYRWDDPSSQGNPDCVLDLPPGIYNYSLTVTDPYGKQGRATVKVRVADGVGPKVTLNGPTPMNLEVFDPWLDPGAKAVDEVDGSDLAITIYGSVNNKKLGDYVLTYVAKDNSGNEGSVTRTVHVQDTKAPVITLNGDNPMTVECTKGYVEPGATAIDNYDGPVEVKISGTVTSAVGTYTVTYTATDSSGNITTATRTVLVADTDGPVITLNGDNPMRVECSQGYVEPGATATDGCLGVTLPVTITGTVLTTNGTYTVTYSATDASGVTATKTRTVIVSDSKAPVITLKGSNPMTVECGSGYTEPGATATDACDGDNLPVTITGSVSSTKGTYTVTYKATDKSGNTTTVTRTVNVTDTIPPVITMAGMNPMNVECATGYVEPGATALDICDGIVPVTITGTVSTGKGTYTVTYTATDSSGNKATVTRTVKVTDSTPPVITLNGPSTLSIECGTGYTELGATATDSCDGGSLPVTITGFVSSSKGTYVRTYTATDSSGNTASVTRTVNVVDTTAPVITLNGASTMTVECSTGFTDPGAFANDTCDGLVSVVITGTVPTSKGTYTRTYKATDSSGNSATVTRTVIVNDTKAPTITLNGSNPMTVECGTGYTEPGATATDACDGSLPVTITGTVLTTKGTYTVTYKATDSSGNTVSVTRTVNVTDTKAPTITLLGSNPMTVECGSGYTEPGATATDSCDGTLTVVITGTVPTTKGTYTRTYKATDSSGNVTTVTRTINVVDTTPPVITLNGSNPMTVDCKQGYTEPGATATDACDGTVTVVITGTVPSTHGTYTVTYKATDSSGNSSTKTRTVTVVSKTPPSANNFNSTPTSIKADNKAHNINLHYGFNQHCADFTWTVTCTANQTVSAGDIVKVDDNNFTVKGVTGRIYTFTLTVTDVDGNTATYTTVLPCN